MATEGLGIPAPRVWLRRATGNLKKFSSQDSKTDVELMYRPKNPPKTNKMAYK